MLRAAIARRWRVACAGSAMLAAAGCTMCPDPFDYAGTVPNGSAPQNDFRARSNGILPIGTAARPFPPVVKASPEQPSPTRPAVAAEPAEDVVRLTAEGPVDGRAAGVGIGERPLGDDAAADGGVSGQPVDEDAAGGAVPAIDGPSATEVAAETESAPAADGDPPPVESGAWRERQEPRPAATGQTPRESPGWRSRR